VTARRLALPLTEADVASLHAGDEVLLTGPLYVARDAAHHRLVAALDRGEPLPFDLAGQTVYYMGPSPAPPGRVIGAAGPTTATRMDPYAPRLLAAGLRGMVGKGPRSPEVRAAIVKYRAVYLAPVGGAGALLSRTILSSEIVAYDDLGPEAIRKLEVKDFPATVIDDIHGSDLYEQGKKRYSRP
jgi:fumarate hydratase subunit beta